MDSRTVLGQADQRHFPPHEQHKIIALATRPPPESGVPITHWSMRDLARASVQDGIVASISSSTVWRLLDQGAIKPHRWHYWLNSPDPNFEAKMLDIVDLYLHAQDLYKHGEIVLSVDEKTSIQALERRYPHKPASRLSNVDTHISLPSLGVSNESNTSTFAMALAVSRPVWRWLRARSTGTSRRTAPRISLPTSSSPFVKNTPMLGRFTSCSTISTLIGMS